MNKIEVAVLNEAHNNPAGMQLFLAQLTQRGHVIHNMDDLMAAYDKCVTTKRNPDAIKALASLPHGTIKRFAPITIAIVGASRRFLDQARTHQVGLDYVSGSLQYSDYSESDQFVVPYALLEADKEAYKEHGGQGVMPTDFYLDACGTAMAAYKNIANTTDNDTAGYAAPQGLRNVLIIQGNHQSWEYFIRLRSCNRNTTETQYVTLLIWEALLGTADGQSLFGMAGPDCTYGKCREGKMSCGKLLYNSPVDNYLSENVGCSLPHAIIETKFPLLKE